MAAMANNMAVEDKSLREIVRVDLLRTLFNYYKKYPELIEPLVNSLPSSNRCEANNANNLTKKSCIITEYYVPFPKTYVNLNHVRSLTNGIIIAKGTYGIQSKHTQLLKNVPTNILTKIPLEFNEEIIKELFLQMVLLNPIAQMLSNFKLNYANIVQSYGFFACNAVPSIYGKKYCDPTAIGQPYLFLMQEYIDGNNFITLHKLLKEYRVSKEFIIHLLFKLYRTLEALQIGEYHITHSDLHCGNILINPADGTLYILDWGHTSFTYLGVRYENMLEKEYKRPGDPTIISGLYDLFLILDDIADASRMNRNNLELSTSIDALKVQFFRHIFGHNFIYTPNEYWLYRILGNLERRGQYPDIANHARNIGIINTYTWTQLSSTFFANIFFQPLWGELLAQPAVPPPPVRGGKKRITKKQTRKRKHARK